jgi:putative inorganic carbon (hco3(-)) transporter
MGFALTLFYIFTNLMTPAEIIPFLVPFRIMLVLLLSTLTISTFTMLTNRFSFSSPQIILVLALVADGTLSVLWAVRWLQAGVDAVMELLFLAGITLMVCWNVTSVGRMKMLAGVLAFTGVLLTADGVIALETGHRTQEFVLNEGNEFDATGNREFFQRIQGLGVLSDPNDLAQFLLVSMALLSVCWKPGSTVSNLLIVVIPDAVLLGGVFLTKSRGALLALLFLLLLLLQRKLGKVGFLVGLGVALAGVAAMTALSGRGLSMSEGSAAGRLDAWYAGMQMFKGSPILGIGFNRFTEHHELTAHNSYMLCLAELGFPGFLIWLGLPVSSLFQASGIANLAGDRPRLDELRRAGRALFNGLVVFMVSAWFLSRSYTTVFFVLVGCAIALSEIARKTMPEARLTRQAWKFATLAGAVSVVIGIYVTLRLRGLA